MRIVAHAWKWTNPLGDCFIYAQIGKEPNNYTMTVGPCGNRSAEAFLMAFQRDDLLTEDDADRARRKADGAVTVKTRRGPRNMEFFATCDGWPISVGALKRMISRGKKVTRKVFLEQVNPDQMLDVEERLGYAQHPREGVVMSADRNVEYYLSEVAGCPCAFFQWSGIEHVFVDPGCRPAE